jgi:hypothetical protein
MSVNLYQTTQCQTHNAILFTVTAVRMANATPGIISNVKEWGEDKQPNEPLTKEEKDENKCK